MKNKLRKTFIERRINLDLNFVKVNSDKIKDNLFNLDKFNRAKKIAIYFSKENEVSTKDIIHSMLMINKEVFLPRVDGDKIDFKRINSLNDVAIGRFNIMEPNKRCASIDPNKLDMIIVPCVAVDKNGNRIGMGAGFYDRFFSDYKTIKSVCLAYDFQLIDEIKADKHDKKIGVIITEKDVIRNE